MRLDTTILGKLQASFPDKASFSGVVLKQKKKPHTFWYGALFISTLCVILGCSSLSAAPLSRPSLKKDPRETIQRKALQSVEKELALAKNEEDTQRLLEKAETLRQDTLNGASRLLLKTAGEKEETGNIPAMESLFSTALSLQPQNALLRRLRAAARLKGNDPTGAVQDLAVSLQDDPGDPMSWLLLAQSQENLHQHIKALNAFHEVLRRAPFLPEKDKILKHFEQSAFGQDD